MSAASSPQLEGLLSRLKRVKKQAGGFIAECPSHEDSSPSLSVGDGKSAVVMWCWAGCNPKDILAAVGLGWPDVFYERRNGHQVVLNGAVGDSKAVARVDRRGMFLEAGMAAERLQDETQVLGRLRDARGWAAPALAGLGVGWDGERLTIPVRDKDGKPHDVLRYDPFGKGRAKMLAGKGQSRLPWPPPEGLRPSKGWPLVIVEGEGTAISLASLGITAVSLPGAVSRPTGDIGRPGAFRGPGWHQRWSKRFSAENAKVVLIPDCDVSGTTLMRTAEFDLQRAGVRVVYLDLRLAKGEDIGDVLRVARNGQARKEAKGLLRAAVECADLHRHQLPGALEMLASWRTYHS